MTTDLTSSTGNIAHADGSAPIAVLVSGSGTLLQALIDASSDPATGLRIAVVGADVECAGLDRARAAGIPTFVCGPRSYASRALWDVALAAELAAYRPGVLITAGFMRLLGPQVLAAHDVLNTHPALLPSFPGARGVRDALAYGVKVTGTTCHWVDAGVDTGQIIEQRTVRIAPQDTEATLHERIKVLERDLLVEIVPRVLRGEIIPPARGIARAHATPQPRKTKES